ncbi:catalase [Fusarium sporotrichioides]|uniref:Catalase n=1 Tax=Fusarium sporotrichioides TaxID=5514 RepID=A0A395SSP8_FUSSP|nr:catalase [Fusarium sporotrichioides]
MNKKNDYNQAKDLWTRVMSDQEKKNTRHNTAKGLQHAKYPEIKSKYLETEFEFSKVKESAETTHEWYKEPKFRPGPRSKLTGYPPEVAVYQS